MAFFYSPNIVTDGLVFAVDAADKNSYPGSGTTWSDLAGNNDGTLTNGPTFDSGSGGNISLDATDDYVSFGSVSATQFDTVDPFSVNFWINISWSDTQSFPIIIGNKDSTSPYYGWEIFGPTGDRRAFCFSIWPNYSSQRLEAKMSTPTPTNQWINACATYDGSKSTNGVSWYRNGVSVGTTALYNTATNNTIPYTSATQNIGNRDALGGGFFQDSSIATCAIYNRELSASEVSQNYNALKGRFNL